MQSASKKVALPYNDKFNSFDKFFFLKDLFWMQLRQDSLFSLLQNISGLAFRSFETDDLSRAVAPEIVQYTYNIAENLIVLEVSCLNRGIRHDPIEQKKWSWSDQSEKSRDEQVISGKWGTVVFC